MINNNVSDDGKELLIVDINNAELHMKLIKYLAKNKIQFINIFAE